MSTYKFCYHWATYGGTGYVIAGSAEEATEIIKSKYPQYDETPSEALLTLSIPINA